MKILIATDGSEFSKAATAMACEILAGQPGATVAIVSAYDMPASTGAEPYVGSPRVYQELIDDLKRMAEDAISSSREMIEKRFSKIKIQVEAKMGRPAEVIIDAARRWEADMIIIGSHGHGFWNRALLGSVSSAVVHHAHCPVLVVRKPELEEGDDHE
jgi:nucleotide-binding universal stress UspA family protein